jgi:hypothetical protein
MVPFARDPDFVDRPEILAWIRGKCMEPAARAALVGLGGVGYVNCCFSFAIRVLKVRKEVTARYPVLPRCPRCVTTAVCVLGACKHQGTLRRSIQRDCGKA